MRTTKNAPPVTVSLIALNTKTGRVERLIHCGHVHSPATARAILPMVRRALKEKQTRITF